MINQTHVKLGLVSASFALLGSLSSAAMAQAAKTEFTSRDVSLERELVGEDLGHIWGMAFLPNGKALLSIKTGGLTIFDPETGEAESVTGGPRVREFGQGGQLDIALSPDFATDNRVYISYAKAMSGGAYTTAIGYGVLSGNRLVGFKDIFVADDPKTTGEHFGGRIVIEDDDVLWLSVGERNLRDNAQRLDNHLGKVLRLTWEGKAHPENPFIGQLNARPEIYSYGHRNPQGLTRNLVTGELWEIEHGPKGGDEVNLIEAGNNYGWPLATYGTEYFGPVIGPTHYEGTIQPMSYWKPSIAPSGMIVYSGDAIPAWKGLVLTGALAGTHLNVLEIQDGAKVAEERLFTSDRLRIRDVEQGPNGEVYYASEDGHLFRIRPAAR